MAGVGREEIAGRVRTALRPAAMVLAGLAAVLLVWAAVFGTWSRLAAPRSLGADDWYLSGLHRWGNGLPSGIGIAVVIVALVLLAAMAFAVWRGRRPDTYLPGGPAAWAAIAALLFFAYVTPGIPAFYRMAMVSAPVTPALPTAAAAWVLSIAGAIATLLAASAFPRLTRSSLRLVAIGAAVAVVAASAVTVAAFRAGDDSRYLDATTAGGVDVPAPPAELGARTFTVALADAFHEDGYRPDYDIASAGAGFVVYQNRRITAYGADGKERWHFARSGPGDVSVNGMAVFDNGATVVAFVDDTLAGLDAVTGEQLWASADGQLVQTAMEKTRYSAPGPFVVDRNQLDDSFTRFDMRTGRELWTGPAPHGGCGGGRPLGTSSRLVSISYCHDGNTTDVRLTVLDPQTGETLWDNAVLHDIPRPAERPQQGYFDMLATPVNSLGLLLQFTGLGAPATPMYVNVVDKTVTPLPQLGHVTESHGPSDDFIMWRAEDAARKLTLFGPDGRQRCQVPGVVNAGGTAVPGQDDGFGLAYVAMLTSFLIEDYRGDGALRTFDSTTCAQTGSVPAESVEGFVPVPGAVLVLRRDGRTLQIDGYRAD
ncbi:PQQ-binding-like beta-propeller repeat protein [Mycobacterium sp. LTG2003]